MNMAEILITGGSGYIGAHVVNECLNAGYTVRATVRDLHNPLKVDPMKKLGEGREDRLKIIEGNLLDSKVWKGLIEGCKYVIHLATVTTSDVAQEDVIIKTATEGTTNVLNGCVEAGTVKRFIFTSSVSAVGFDNTKTLTEEDWAEAKPGSIASHPYSRAKTTAEKDVWKFVKGLPDEKKFEIVVLAPSYVLGPPLTMQGGFSMDLGKSFLAPNYFVAKVSFAIIDVRDVAEAFVIAMTSTEAAGHRIILNDRSWWFAEVREFLNEEFRQHGYRLSTRVMPLWLLKLIIRLTSDVEAKLALILWDNQVDYDNSKMKSLLGMTPRSSKQAIIDMAYELIEIGFVERKTTYKGRLSLSDGGQGDGKAN